MSQSSNTRIKDAGRKPYNSLNVAFKPSKGEPKSTVGQNVRHGLQVLGKVGPRRTPAPTNLPSLKSENSGNDPCINLVPSGQGWGKKENAAAAGKKGEKPPAAPAPVQAKAVPPKAIDSQEISLRPNAGVGLNIKPPTLPPPTGGTGGENQDSAKMTWGNKVQQRQPASGSSQHFHREFPKLGGSDVKGGECIKGEGPHEENVPDASPQAMVPPPEFMSRMQVPMNMQPFSGERPIFSGAQMQYPYIYPLYPAPHGGRMMPPYPYHYGYPGAGGKVQPIDPRMMERMAKGQMMGMPIPQTDRPSVVKDADLRSLDDHKDDGDNGWAGTHEEVDYSAKLQFDESDDSEDEVKVQTSKRSDTQRAHGEHGKDEKNQASQENWNEFATHPYNQQQMMMAFANHHPHWQRPPFSGYDPQRGPPPGPHAFPFPGMYPHPMFFQNIQPQSGDNAEDQRKGGERMESKEEGRVDKKEMERKARLKKIEEGIKRREEESRQTVEIMKKVSGDDDVQEGQRLDRSRNNSEASDSSRRSNTVDIPPRFRRQISNHDPLIIGDGEIADNRSGSESPHLTIMKRKDSVKSEDSLLKEEVFKKIDVPSEKINVDNADEKYMYDKLDQRTSRHGSSSSLYKETIKNERQKRYSSSSDSHDKDRHSFHGSSSSIHKENEKKEATEKSYSKKELKDLSETRIKDKKEKGRSDKSKKSALLDDTDGGTKGADTLKINSGRFADMKLNKGQAKVVSTVKEDVHFEQEKKDEPTKASPWSNVVSGKPPVNDKSDRTNKSLRDIQQEEEEENRKLKKVDVHKTTEIDGVPGDEVYENHNAQRNMRMPPDESRFRSDGYEDRGMRNQQQPFMGEDRNNEGRGYERRGRFNNSRPFRKENEEGYRQNFNRYKDNESRNGRGGGDPRFTRDDSQGWNQRRGGEYNNRRDDYNDRKDYNRNDYRTDRRDEHKVETRDDMHNDRRDEHKNDVKDDHKGDRRDDHKNDRHDDHKNKRRDEHKTDRRGDHKNERRDDEKKEEHKAERKEHKNERREDNRGDRREDHRRTERKDDHKNERRDEHGHEWKDGDRNERTDRRQKDYKDDSKEDINKFERREFDSKKDDNEKEDKGNDWRKVDKKDEYNKRYDKRENRRDANKKENYRKNDAKEDKKDDKKNNYRDDHRKKDDRIGRRDLGRPERDGSRRYQQEQPKDLTEDNRPQEARRKKDEWNNRDYRLAEDYQKDLKAMQEIKESKRAEEAVTKEANKQASELDTEEIKDTEVELSTADGEKAEVLQEELVKKTTKEPTEEVVTLNDVEKKTDEIVKIECSTDILPVETYSEKVSRIEGVETEIKVLNDLSEGLLQLDLTEKCEKDGKEGPDLIDLTKDNEELQVQVINQTGGNIDPKDTSVSMPLLDVVDVGESVGTDVKSIVSDVNEEDGKPKVAGGFGVPHKQNKKFSRSEFQSSNYRTDNNYRGDTNYRGGESNYRGDSSNYRGSQNYRGSRERGRGRGRSYTRGGSAVMTQTRRPSGGRYRGGSTREESRRRKDDGVYEPISSDELSDSDTEDKKNKSNNNDLKSSRKKQPPRFQQRYDSQEPRGRGRGRGRGSSERGRGHVRERGRGRGRGRGGSLHSVPSTHSTTSTSAENKGTDGESDAYFSADETITQEEKDDPNDEKRISSPNLIDRETKSRTRGLHRTRVSRGSTRNPRGSSKNGSFLVNRQQVGNKRNSNKSDKTLSAADKSDISIEVLASGKTEGHARNQLNLEDISTHSLPKKSKNQIEKREDRKHEIYKEFDLNNIASVVCIDNIKVGVEQVSNASLEEEGFVTVTSKKQQKEKRDREREELKKKMLLEQKQEPSTVNKVPKPARNTPKGTNISNINISKVKPTPFAADASITSPTTEQIHTSTAVAVSSPLSQPPSNVAMAAFGVWEPAQSLMRTSQQSNPCSNDMIKTSLTGTISTSINAWQRPLSLSATTDISMPDPRAVGTGKPSSSHTSLMNKSNLVSIQPTSETSSTLVTPPTLAPIGSGNLNNTNDLSAEIANAVIATDDRIADILPETNQKKDETIGNDFDTDIHQGDMKNEIKREKSARIKLTKTEKAPRFQMRKESEDRGKNDDGRKARPPRPPSGEKTQKRSLDRPRKGDVKSGQGKKTMHSKEVEKQVDENSPIVFINEIPMLLENQLEKGTPKSTLSDADKVVGSNKPSLKSQSSLGSYSSSVDTNIEEPIMEVNIQESFQPPLENELPVESDEQKVDGVRCTSISTLNNDDERSLETRSLPGTPPLAVKIPEPSPPGPSSDPGRGPSPPNIDKSIMPSVAQEMNKEMNEMNRRLLNARRAWEDTPTTWSDTAVVSSSASPDVVAVAPVESSAPQAIIDDSNIPGSPSKTESSVTAPIEVRQKSSEEKVSVSGGVFSSKRTEQQVCKVKPQQQLPSEEIKSYQTSSRQARQLSTQRTNSNQKYASYGIPMERTLQQNSSTLYTSESVYGSEQHRSQNNPALNFQSLTPGRSISTSASPHSQQRDMVLSSLQVGNMYSANTLQVSQSQFLAWQVTPTVQPTKTVPYQTYTQGSSFTSPVSIAANSPVIMQYGATSFAPQRSTSNMQRQHQHVNLMPLQQHQPAQGGRLVGMMPSRGGSHVRRNQQYQTLQSTSDGRIVNPNQMALMLEPNAANMNHPQQLSRQQMSGQQISGQQISNQQMSGQHISGQQISGQQLQGQQRSDLMKHVHAKPFEPTSQTPPLMQSPPVVAPSSLPLQQLHQHQPQQQSPQQQPQQQLGPSVFNQPASIPHQEHVQNIHNYSQPIIQQRQHSVQHMQHQPPLVASVRPRSIQEQSLSNGSTSLPMSNQDRVNNISPFSSPFLASNVSYKGRSSRVNLQVAMPQQALNNQFTQHALQTRHGPSRSPTVALNLLSGPGPIQRPQVHQQSTLPHDKSSYVIEGVATDGVFKQTQRQKMLEDTKKYFEQDQKSIISETEKAAEEKPVSSVAPTLSKIDLSKHNKVVLPNTKENNGKKIEYKKTVRNGEKTRPSKRIQPTKGTGAAAKKSGD